MIAIGNGIIPFDRLAFGGLREFLAVPLAYGDSAHAFQLVLGLLGISSLVKSDSNNKTVTVTFSVSFVCFGFSRQKIKRSPTKPPWILDNSRKCFDRFSSASTTS